MLPKVALVVVTDGRGEYLEQTIPSLNENLRYRFASRTIIDDSGSDEYANWLDISFPTFSRVHHAGRRGLAGAVRSAWETALEVDPDFVWHHEDDFTLNEPIVIEDMAQMLGKNDHLAQLVLKRQPWSAAEIAAGGQIESDPDAYTDCDGWIEHSHLFSFNPCLISRYAIDLGLASLGDGLERGITDSALNDGLRFAYWGGRQDPPRCHHIGDRRSVGYRW